MAAKYPCHLLADSPEGIRKGMELIGRMLPPILDGRRHQEGYCLQARAARHAKSIANSADIEEGMARQ
jgi:hypothetical protein